MARNWRLRKDERIPLTLDSNVWNFLFDRKLRLADELPLTEFAFYIVREVEIESAAIQPAMWELRDYICETIEECQVKTTSVFGFARTEGTGPERYGGFGRGTFQSAEERKFYDAIREHYLVGRSLRPSELHKNEADAAVAAQSFSSVVLTNEKANKSGPIRAAIAMGGTVISLRGFDDARVALKQYVLDRIPFSAWGG